jgi:hypothetical protein
MTTERIIRIMAGFFILLSLALGATKARSLSRNGSSPSPPLSASTFCKAALPASVRRKSCSPN